MTDGCCWVDSAKWRPHHVRSAIAEGGLEFEHHLTAVSDFKPVIGDRRTRHVTAHPIQFLALMRLTAHAGVQAESIELDTQAARFIGSMTAVAEDHSVSLPSELMWGRVLLLVYSQRRTPLPMCYTPRTRPTDVSIRR